MFFYKNRIEVKLGNITDSKCDAIVNAANTSLLGGGGVDGAIHKAAGTELLDHCRELNGCAPGHAVVTPGFELNADFIIHTVGPFYTDGNHKEDETLASSYYESLKIAYDRKIKSIAFPSISTGAYRFPVSKASAIAAKTILNFLRNFDYPYKVEVICFDRETFAAYLKAFSEVSRPV